MRKYGSLLLIILLSASLILVGCNNSDEPAEEPAQNVEEQEEDVQEEDAEEIELSMWDGEWNSVYAFMDAEEVKAELAAGAEEAGVSVEDFTAEKAAGIKSDFDSMVIENGKVTFNDGKIGEGSEIASAGYAFKESLPIEHGGQTYYWHVFEADAEADNLPKVLLLMEVHGEQSLAHYHMRYGDDAAVLEAMEDWYPTFVRTNATIDLIAGEIAE